MVRAPHLEEDEASRNRGVEPDGALGLLLLDEEFGVGDEQFAAYRANGFLRSRGVGVPCFCQRDGETFVVRVGRAGRMRCRGPRRGMDLAVEGFGKVIRKGAVFGIRGLCFKGQEADAVGCAAEDMRHGVVFFVRGAFGGNAEVGLVCGKLLGHFGGAVVVLIVVVGVRVGGIEGATNAGGGCAVVVVADGDDVSGRGIVVGDAVGGDVLDLVLGCAA